MGGAIHRKIIRRDQENLTKIIEACNEIMAYNVRIELLRAEISRRPSRREMFEKPRYEGTVWSDYQGFSNELYQNVRYESQKELEITEHVLKFLPSLFPIQIISNVEAVINMFENFCQLNLIDELNYQTDENRIKFNLLINILPSATMLCYFNSNNVEHRSYDNLKKFLRSEYTRSCEKFKRSEPLAQKGNVISKELLKSLDDEIKIEKKKLSRKKAEVAAQKGNVISKELLKSLDDEIKIEKEKLSRRKAEVSREKAESAAT